MSKNKNNDEDHNPVDELLNQLNQLVEESSDELNAPKAKDELNTKIVKAFIEQYLSPYVIIGYDIKGRRINLSNVSSQKDYDLMSFAISQFIGFNNSGGDDEISSLV